MVRQVLKPRLSRTLLGFAFVIMTVTILCTLQRELMAYAALSQDGSILHEQASLLEHPTMQRVVPFDPSAPIPHRLWQISRFKNLTTEQAKAVKTWYDQNPGMPIELYDDAMADAFILDFYGPKIYKTYKSFPLGIMRGDFWRYAILYAYGGIYSDTDTRCIKPVNQWFPPKGPPPENNQPFNPGSWNNTGGLNYTRLSWDDCSMVVAVEWKPDFCQWTIAGVAGHPLLATIQEMILHRSSIGFDTSQEHISDLVHDHTGPSIWTDAVCKVLGLPMRLEAKEVIKKAWTDSAIYRRARSIGLCLMAKSFFNAGDDGHPPENVDHLFASEHFKEDGYTSWKTEAQALASGPPTRAS